jgi:hypothetical protein
VLSGPGVATISALDLFSCAHACSEKTCRGCAAFRPPTNKPATSSVRRREQPLLVKTVLDEGHTWFLDALGYRNGMLAVVVIEGFRAARAEEFELPGLPGHTVHNTRRIEPAEHSRRVEITFERAVAWQCVNESWTAFDEYEQREDDGALQVLTRSKYLDYAQAVHGWFADVIGPAKHYRVWTEDDVGDVVAVDPPSLRLLAD